MQALPVLTNCNSVNTDCTLLLVINQEDECHFTVKQSLSRIYFTVHVLGWDFVYRFPGLLKWLIQDFKNLVQHWYVFGVTSVFHWMDSVKLLGSCFVRVLMVIFPLQPTPCHYFLRLLHDRGLLLRHYTQVSGRIRGWVGGWVISS